MFNLFLQLEKLIGQNHFLHQSAKEAYRGYLRAYHSHQQKHIFDINTLDLKKVNVYLCVHYLVYMNHTLLSPPFFFLLCPKSYNVVVCYCSLTKFYFRAGGQVLWLHCAAPHRPKYSVGKTTPQAWWWWRLWRNQPEERLQNENIPTGE